MAAGFSLAFRQWEKTDYLGICILTAEKCPFYPPGSFLIPSHTWVPKLFYLYSVKWALVTAEDIMVARSTASTLTMPPLPQCSYFKVPYIRSLGSQAVPGNFASLQQCQHPEQPVWKETAPLSCIWKTFTQGKLSKEVSKFLLLPVNEQILMISHLTDGPRKPRLQ